MTNPVGSGMLALLGENPIPQGTPDELRKEGVDPARIGSCAPRSPGVRGCPVWNDCPFGLQKYGGFKGHGPKYVGYYLKTHEDRQKQDFLTCHAFTRVLWSRMRTGIAASIEGKPHEIVRIIAQEGDEIRTRVAVPKNPNDKSPSAEYVYETKTVKVPTHPRPGENAQTSYDADLWAEEMVRRKYDPDFQTGLPPSASDPDESFEDAAGADVLEMGGEAEPLAVPMAEEAKGKKR